MELTDDGGGAVSEMEPKTPTRECKGREEEEEQPRKKIISRRQAVEYMGVPVQRMLTEISLHNLIFHAQSPSSSNSSSPGGGGGNHDHWLRSNKLANPGSNCRRSCPSPKINARTRTRTRTRTTLTLTKPNSITSTTPSKPKNKTTSPRDSYNALLVLEKEDSGVENNKLVQRKKFDSFRPKVVKEVTITPKPVTPNLAPEKKPYRRKRKWPTLGKNITESSYTPSEDIQEMTIAQLKYQSRFSCRRALKFDCENMTMDQTKYSDVKAGCLHTTHQYGSSYNSKVYRMQKDMSSQIGRLVVPHKKPSTRCSSLALEREEARGFIPMGNDGTEGAIEKASDTIQEIRELETQFLLERVESFMSTMKFIQGNGHFSRWKGSVVDSVAGAFLAQNVSDNLSSSAFMNLAAKYPTAKKSPFEGTRSKRVVNKSKGSYLKNKTEKGESQKTKKRKFDLIKKYEDLDRKTNRKSGKGKACEVKEENTVDWERLRKSSTKAEEASDNHRDIDGNSKDALDWHAVNCAELSEVSEAIECRGMNNKLAFRIKKFLLRLKEEHGSLDLEWLRALPHQRAKEFLLSIRGLGTKSVECIRLLTLQHAAFPVDTNVARIAVRLGWVPLEPLPEGVQLHHLKMYPMVNSVHKYLSERLCFEQKKLNELHFQMITFGKVICTKINPNCNACPLKGECKHFASEYASAKVGLSVPRKNTSNTSAGSTSLVPAEANLSNLRHQSDDVCGPVVASTQPTPPRGKDTAMVVRDIEDLFHENAPPITFNSEAFMKNVRNYIQENHIPVREDELTEGLVDLISKGVFLPAKKQKINDNQRTKHIVYELPDSHSLLERFDKREVDDECPYLLATWTTGEIRNSSESPKEKRDSGLEVEGHTLLGTLLIPCRTATRGIFPLDGTYFQTNEVFADHQTSLCPIKVPRELIHGLLEKTMYCGTSVRAIYRGLSIQEIVHCFWRGYICLRGFNRWTREPTSLAKALHSPKGSKIEKDNHEKKEVL